jgi:hypothetical protein
MSAAPEYDDRDVLHEIVDRLTPEHARHLRLVAQDLVRVQEGVPDDAVPEPRKSGHRFSFTGIGDSGLGDIATRTDDYLAEMFDERRK